MRCPPVAGKPSRARGRCRVNHPRGTNEKDLVERASSSRRSTGSKTWNPYQERRGNRAKSRAVRINQENPWLANPSSRSHVFMTRKRALFRANGVVIPAEDTKELTAATMGPCRGAIWTAELPNLRRSARTWVLRPAPTTTHVKIGSASCSRHTWTRRLCVPRS